ncbi:hypothetical protein CLG96_02190 [Sphingomonas oleivorans]|uniref:HTH cro/C1-type domain-containing protein n=1 Tax=Sphingomonas oleivorans TaxID=1735121 RepID=A0A2T5G1F2_9SPHN|nr:helix-turn-helix transcriptional regulator [Sphingomonas oleivorans]PTQ12975.1 hypothetical protein CLG96_02190 [Sphingomonas oleivorans]
MMQADELKALRKALGLTQAELGEALGMTSKYVGMMERGEAAIEIRTALAMRYLAEHPEAARAEV